MPCSHMVSCGCGTLSLEDQRIMSFQCQKDSYLQTFKSKVVSCKPAKLDGIDGYEIVMEDTILFPEGGGQV